MRSPQLSLFVICESLREDGLNGFGDVRHPADSLAGTEIAGYTSIMLRLSAGLFLIAIVVAVAFQGILPGGAGTAAGDKVAV